MKNYISFVIQKGKNHSHHSEVIDIKAPQYSYSTDTQVPEVLKWAEIAQSKLQTDEKLVILNMFKI